MEKFKKLSRAEMRNVLGGESPGCPCSNECHTNDDCPSGSDCNGPEVACPSGNCTYNVCSPIS